MTALVWVQILVVVVGTAWLLALIGIACVGGWYAHTHSYRREERSSIPANRSCVAALDVWLDGGSIPSGHTFGPRLGG